MPRCSPLAETTSIAALPTRPAAATAVHAATRSARSAGRPAPYAAIRRAVAAASTTNPKIPAAASTRSAYAPPTQSVSRMSAMISGGRSTKYLP